MQHQAAVGGSEAGAGTCPYVGFRTDSSALAPVTRADEYKLKQVHLRVVRMVRRPESVFLQQEAIEESGSFILAEQRLKWM